MGAFFELGWENHVIYHIIVPELNLTEGCDCVISTTAAGKLYLAGEYAVVHAGFPAILMAVNRFVAAQITPANKGLITSAQSKLTCHFNNDNHHLTYWQDDDYFNFIKAAQGLVEQLARENKLPAKTYHIHVDSQLDNAEGQKFGLGSSAAVVVAVVDALLQLYQLKNDKLTIYKIAALAHYQTQGNGSLGDVAASVYGGFLAYRSPDRDWLLCQANLHSVTELIAMPWAKLQITPLPALADLAVVVGWTNAPASTKKLVNQVEQKNQTAAFKQFLAATNQCVTKLHQAWCQNDTATILHQLSQNRQLLNSLQQITGVLIETPQLTKLCQSAINLGGAGKSSGAGGGDCGIALIAKDKVSALKASWQQNNITPLDLTVSEPTKEGGSN